MMRVECAVPIRLAIDDLAVVAHNEDRPRNVAVGDGLLNDRVHRTEMNRGRRRLSRTRGLALTKCWHGGQHQTQCDHTWRTHGGIRLRVGFRWRNDSTLHNPRHRLKKLK